MSTVDPHLMSGAYALDALTDEERAEFEAHLVDCADCAVEVAELQETAGRLAVLSAEVAPASLRESVLAGISSTRQLPPEPKTEPAAEPGDGETVHLPPVGRPGSAWARRLTMPVAAALLGILAISLGAWGVSQRDRADDLHAKADLVASVLTAPDARTSSTKVGDGRASLVVSPRSGQAVMVGTGLAQPADGKVYEMWRIDSAGTAVPAGTYRPATSGTVAVPIDGSLAGTKTLAITVEPEGGSEQPTSAPVAAFPLA